MNKYLDNELVEFIPLFDINYNIKKNLLCGTFFKLKNSYKDFNIYIDSLGILYNDFIKYSNFNIRLFIDDDIYKDLEIMTKIKKLEKIELVLFRCLDSKLTGLFPTLIRFFPMFNFYNNDSNIVIIIDIDDKVSHTLYTFEKIKEKIFNLDENIFNNIYLIKIGNLSKNVLYKYKSIYKNNINIYSLAQSIINIKKIDYNIIINFINKIKNTSKLYTYYKIFRYNKTEFDIKMNQTRPFIYGIDEYFINDILTKYLINNKLLLINNINWYLFGHYYYIINRNVLTLTNIKKNIIKKIFILILNKINYKVKNESFLELFNIVNKLIYIDKNIKVIKIIYEFFLLNYQNEKLKFLFPTDLSEILVKPEYKNIYEFEKIIFVNSKYKEITINIQKLE
jgi:hypothetical protein